MAMLPSDPDTKKKFLLGAVMVLLVAYAGWEYLLSPRWAEAEQVEQRQEALELQNRAARGLAARDGDTQVETRLAAYRAQLERVEGLIPTSEELPNLLDLIAIEAGRAGVELSLIQPVSATEEEFYTRRVYDVAVLGAYHDIGDFLTRVGSLPRIITPTDLRLTPQSGREEGEGRDDARLEARFSIETYVLPTDRQVEEDQ
jgi:type IV pilus assembly protein PilO